MPKQTQFDPVTLSAVKPGLDEALGVVGARIGEYLAKPEVNAPALEIARTELHRLLGVLRMIRLDGGVAYCAEIERVLDELAGHPTLVSPLYQTVLQRALSALNRYLDALVQGADNATLRLFPKYEAMQHLRGMEMSFEQDLFFPNLNIPLPESVQNIVQPANCPAKLKAAHSKYQRGLMLLWRGNDLVNSLPMMQEALEVILSCVAQDENRAFWWLADGLLECVRLEGVPLDMGVRKLLVRMDRRMRATLKNNLGDARSALLEMLYLIGRSEKTDEQAEQIKRHYALDRYLPDHVVAPSLEEKKSLEELREQLQEAENNWEHCVAGDPDACGRFVGYVEKVALKSDKLKSRQPQRLTQQIKALLEYLRAPDYARLIGEEVAMALLQWQSGVGNQETLDNRFQEQARIFSEQLAAAVSRKPGDAQRMAELMKVYSSTEQGAVTASLAKEMLLNMEHVELALNAFFEDAQQRDELAKLQKLLGQVAGGLRMLALEQADKLLQEIQPHVRGYAEQAVMPKPGEIHAMVGAVAALHDYLRQLAQGNNEHIEPLQAAYLALAALRDAVPSNATPVAKADQPSGAVVQHPLGEDLELLGIFLEEAREVLGIMFDNVEFSQMNPANPEPLITIRRGFHTLKGSGRMVGLTDLGEVAWAAERAMNKWLQEKKPSTPGLLSFIQSAIAEFSGWVAELERQGWVSIKADQLVAYAEQIEHGVDPELAALLNTTPVLQPIPEPEPAEESAEPDSVIIGELALSPTLFNIAREEARQHILAMQHHLAAMHTTHPPVVAYEFMRAAHTLAGVCRNTGFTAVVYLAAALEGWLQTHIDRLASPGVEQLQMLDEVVSALDEMVGNICNKQIPQPRDELVRRVLEDKETVIGESEQTSLVAESAAMIAEPSTALPEVLEVPVENAVAAEAVTATEQPIPVEAQPVTPVAKEQKAILRDDVDMQLLPVFLEEVDELGPKTGSCLRILRATPLDEPSLQLLKRLLHTLKGSARMTGAMRIGDIAHSMEGRLLAGVQAGEVAIWDALEVDFDRINVLLDELRTGVVQVEAPTEAEHDVELAPVSSDRRTAPRVLHVGAERALLGSVLRVRSEIVDRLVNQAGEISVARSRMEAEMRAFKEGLMELSGSVTRLRKQLREVEIQAESQIQARISLANESNEQFDPLEFDRFTRLQELTRFMNESVHDVQTVQHSLLKNIDETSSAMLAQARLNRDLQENLMHVRMVPFGSMSERLYRIVRQTARDLNKRANLELIGTGVELDRSVLERMAAPFEHLLRNALAHGLEDEQLRINSGKDALGEIRLSLRQESNEVVFEFSDDGSGLDFTALREKAISKGLLDASDDTVSDDQLAQLIFTSGVSTARAVTEVSGRGIGMDVVRSEIAALGGRIDVSSRAGKGTNFTIHLPLTLAVTQVLMMRSGETLYAVPSTMVEQVRQVKPAELEAVYAERKVAWQDKIYPFHYLPVLLGDEERIPESQPHNPLVLLRSGEQRIALHVDELLGNQEAVVKNIGPQLAHMPGIAGATVLGDGSVVLILNPVQMTQRIGATVRKAQKTVPVALRVQPLVMVVDDSLTVRKITTRLLSRAGYQVVTAKDGVDALEQLTEIMPSVMLLDIEMPRMDGFELAKLLRRDEKTRQLPIIMITSRTADKHRDHALQLGVNAYMGKPYQEDELLEKIAQLLVSQSDK